MGPPRTRHQAHGPLDGIDRTRVALRPRASIGNGSVTVRCAREGVARLERMLVKKERRSCRLCVVHESSDEPSAISTAWLNPLPGVHLPPINQLVLLGPYPVDLVGTLIFRRASRLDAFSGYPFQT